MIANCENCCWWCNDAYKTLRTMENLGFCNRFKEVTNRNDKDCIGFNPSKQKEDFFRNLAKAKELKIDLQQKLEL